MTVRLADNPAGMALMRHLSGRDITIAMEDYAGMEKVGPIGIELPRNDSRVSVGAGDLVLYQGRYLCIYYAANSWSFTRIGKVEGVDAAMLRDMLGEGDISITLSINR